MSKRPSKSLFLHDLLNWIERGETRHTMCRLLNYSNQRLSYHIATLKAKGFIEQVQDRPISLYRLTPLGSRVKEILLQSDTDFYKMWRCHNLILGWPIADFGTWRFNEKLWKTMKNWHFQEMMLKGHKIHIHDTGLVKIYCPEKYAVNADEGFDEAVSEAQKVAAYLQSKYSLSLGNRYRIRNGQKELIGSEKLAEMIGHMKIGGVFVDISDSKNRRLEADQDNYGIEKLLALPEMLEKQMIPVIEQLTKQINLHLEVTAEIKNGIKSLTEAVDELRNAIRELRK